MNRHDPSLHLMCLILIVRAAGLTISPICITQPVHGTLGKLLDESDSSIYVNGKSLSRRQDPVTGHFSGQ